MINLSSVEKQIAGILIDAANSKRTVTFTEIMTKVGISRRKLGEYLSHIGHKCIELGLPIITVLVVYKSNGLVGDGYDEFEPDFKNNPDLVEAEKERVYNNKSWVGLSDDIIEIDGIWTNDIVSKEGNVFCQKRNMRVRDIKLRNECLEKKGKVCAVCGFDATKVYGKKFSELIEVHHLNPIAKGERNTTIDDLVPVCPNCHRALHSKEGETPYTIEELKKIMKI